MGPEARAIVLGVVGGLGPEDRGHVWGGMGRNVTGGWTGQPSLGSGGSEGTRGMRRDHRSV